MPGGYGERRIHATLHTLDACCRPGDVRSESTATARRCARAHQEFDDHGRLRLPRPGVPVRRHGPAAGCRQPGRGRRLRGGRPGDGWHDQPAGLGRTGRGPRPDRERPAGPADHLDRLPRGTARALGRRRSRPAAGVPRGALDGPVQRDGRGRHDRARRRGPTRPRTRPADAGVGGRPRGPDGRDHRSRRRPAAGAHRPGRRPRGLRPGQSQLARAGRRLGRAAGGRGGCRAGQGARGQAGDPPPGVGRGALAADGGRGRRRCGPHSTESRSPTPRRRSSPTAMRGS